MIDQLIALGPYQWIGLIFGILYIIAAVQENPLCWIFGIISCAAIAIEDFTQTQLYQDGVLQIFYIIISFYGLYKWKQGGDQDQTPFKIQTLSSLHRGGIGIVGVVLSLGFGWLVGRYTDAAFPYVDGLTTVFSVIATILLVYKYYENWLLWIIIDIVYTYLFWDRSAPLFSILYFIFTIMAIVGLLQWRKRVGSIA